MLKVTCRTLFFHRRNGEPKLAVKWKWTATLTLSVRLVEKNKQLLTRDMFILKHNEVSIYIYIYARCLFAPYSSRYLFLLSRCRTLSKLQFTKNKEKPSQSTWLMTFLHEQIQYQTGRPGFPSSSALPCTVETIQEIPGECGTFTSSGE